MKYRWLKNCAMLGALILATALFGCGSDDDDPMDPGDGGSNDTTAPTVIWTEPGDGTLMVLTEASCEVVFSEAMDPTSSAGQVTLSHGTVTMAEWGPEMNLQVMYEGVPAGTRFTLTLGTGLMDVAGNPLKAPVVLNYGSWSDELDMFEMSPSDGAVDINRSSSIVLDFVAEMDPSSVGSGITITDDTKAVLPFEANSFNRSTWILDPVDDLPADTEITVTIGTSVISQHGTSYETPYMFSFTTNDQTDSTPPTIVSFDPPHMSTMPANQTEMTITFSEPINPDRFKPSHLNGQLWWLLDGATADPSFDASFTVLTVPLPAELPPGLALEAVFTDFEDMVGNVQNQDFEWEVDIAGQAEPYPVSDGRRWFMMGAWADGELGSELPTETGEEWIWYQFEDRSAANQWEKQEWDDPDFMSLGFYEIQEVNSGGVFLRGFAESDGGSLQEFMTSNPLTVAEFPLSAGNTWSSDATITIPGEGTLQVETTGSVVGQADLVIGERDGIIITWTGSWQLAFDVELSAGGTKFGTDHTDFWIVPGVGIVREMYREENSDPEEMYWHTYDRWLEIEEP